MNNLIHADPDVSARLAELGGRLSSGGGGTGRGGIRELSRERRELVEGLVRRALDEAGQLSPSAALRDEVTDTFNAALADPSVAEQVAAGALQKAVHWAGFGPGIGTRSVRDRLALPRRGLLAPGEAPAASGQKAAGRRAGTAVPAATRKGRRPGRYGTAR